jgi:hypothetical protein
METPHSAEEVRRFDFVASSCLASVAVAMIISVEMIWSRGQRLLGHDSFAYLEFAKQFKEHPPTRLGDWWPFGFPVTGTLVSLLTGVSTYTALFIVSALAYWSVLSGLVLESLRSTATKLTTLVFTSALACAPICAVLLIGPMSEPLFTATLFWLAWSMAYWPKRTAIAFSVGLALVAFCIRYAGIFAFGVVALYALIRFNRIREKKSLVTFAILYGLGVAAALVLMYTNYLFYGHATGPQPVGKESFLSWPIHLAAFGWSPVEAFISGALLKDVGGIGNWRALLIGWTSTTLMLGLCLYAWKRPASLVARPAALLAAAYILSMVTLRATTPFDAVSSGRTFLPVLFLLGLLAFQICRARAPRALVVASVLSLVLSLILALRGVSKETYGPISGAITPLARVLTAESTVAVNAQAVSLAAYFPNHFFLTADPSALPPSPGASQFVVIVAKRTGRYGQQVGFEANWLDFADGALKAGTASLVERNADFIILRSTKMK